MLSEKESAFMRSQRLLHFSTVSADGQPDVVPLGYEFDGTYFYVGGTENQTTRKYKNAKVNPKVALVFDGVNETERRVQGLKVYGAADIVTRDGRTGPGEYIRVRPEVHWSWGIEGEVFVNGRAQFKKTYWRQEAN